MDPEAVAPCAKPFGSYIVQEVLGRGGMAVVYRAESRRPESFGKIVALKHLLAAKDDFDLDFDVVRSFIEEARLATRFRHENIARTYSLGKAEGTYFIEMEYVHGPTLYQLARQANEIAGAIPVAVVIQILIQICDALDHVHELRDDTGVPLDLVHRDVSLTNIIISDDGIVKLIDFGIVKGHSVQAHTEAGTIKGKLAYIAPEYLTGHLDRRADLFALGVIAHELLVGQRLFHGTSDLDTITRLRDLRIPPPSRSRPEVSPALEAIVMRALARDPDARWQTAAEMRAALVASAGRTRPAQVRDWVTWAFQCEAPKISQVLRVLESIEVETDHVEPEPVEPPPIAVRVASRIPYLALSAICAVLAVVLTGTYFTR